MKLKFAYDSVLKNYTKHGEVPTHIAQHQTREGTLLSYAVNQATEPFQTDERRQAAERLVKALIAADGGKIVSVHGAPPLLDLMRGIDLALLFGKDKSELQEMASLLVEKGCALDFTWELSGVEWTPIAFALRQGNLKLAKLMLDKGASVAPIEYLLTERPDVALQGAGYILNLHRIRTHEEALKATISAGAAGPGGRRRM